MSWNILRWFGKCATNLGITISNCKRCEDVPDFEVVNVISSISYLAVYQSNLTPLFKAIGEINNQFTSESNLNVRSDVRSAVNSKLSTNSSFKIVLNDRSNIGVEIVKNGGITHILSFKKNINEIMVESSPQTGTIQESEGIISTLNNKSNII